MANLDKLIDTVKKLRSQDGCDWDKIQTQESLIPYLLEETYDVIEAIEKDDFLALKEELGDLLLHIVFQAEILSEKKNNSIKDSIENVINKLTSRHPHIFNNKKSNSCCWECAKWRELTTLAFCNN